MSLLILLDGVSSSPGHAYYLFCRLGDSASYDAGGLIIIVEVWGWISILGVKE